MKLSVTRSGGYAGLTEDMGVTDTALLDESLVRELQDAVREADFFNLSSSEGGLGADMFHYEVTIEDAGRTNTVGFNYGTDPETANLRRIVDAVIRAKR